MLSLFLMKNKLLPPVQGTLALFFCLEVGAVISKRTFGEELQFRGVKVLRFHDTFFYTLWPEVVFRSQADVPLATTPSRLSQHVARF